MRHDVSMGPAKVEWSFMCEQWVVFYHDKSRGKTVKVLPVMTRAHWRKAQTSAAQYLGCKTSQIEVSHATGA